MKTITIIMGLKRGDSSMDDTVEVRTDIEPLPPSWDQSDFDREGGCIATFAEPEEIDWPWIYRVATSHGARVEVTFRDEP